MTAIDPAGTSRMGRTIQIILPVVVRPVQAIRSPVSGWLVSSCSGAVSATASPRGARVTSQVSSPTPIPTPAPTPRPRPGDASPAEAESRCACTTRAIRVAMKEPSPAATPLIRCSSRSTAPSPIMPSGRSRDKAVPVAMTPVRSVKPSALPLAPQCTAICAGSSSRIIQTARAEPAEKQAATTMGMRTARRRRDDGRRGGRVDPVLCVVIVMQSFPGTCGRGRPAGSRAGCSPPASG